MPKEEDKGYMTILSVREGDGKELVYRIVCPKKMGKADLMDCGHCSNRVAYSTERSLEPPLGTMPHESIPAVYCDYPPAMPKDDKQKFIGLYMGFIGRKPGSLPHDPDEFDAIVEECLSHIPKRQREG